MFKKSLLLSVLLILFSTNIGKAQAALLVLLLGDDVASEDFYFSIKGGANYSDITGINDGSSKLGFNFGLAANIKLSDKFFVVAEFTPVSNKGVKSVNPLITGTQVIDSLLQNPSSASRNFNYIDIPVLLKYQISKQFSVAAGPQFSYLLSAVDYVEADIPGDDNLFYENNIKSLLNKFDYGLVADLTYSLTEARGGKGINIHFRYGLGLADILKDNSGDALKNSVFQFAVSFPFILVDEEKE